jgi:hypothetical protein
VFGCGFGLGGIDGHSADGIFSEGGWRRHEFKKLLTPEIAENLAEDAEKTLVHLRSTFIDSLATDYDSG